MKHTHAQPLFDHDLRSEPVSLQEDRIQGADENPFDKVRSAANQRVKQIWAIGGGKGGVGKSLVSSSLAIGLARSGHKVTAIDLDLGAANLHTLLGVDLPKQTLSDYISGRAKNLDECAVKTHIPNLEIISGAQDSVGVADISLESKVKLLSRLREIDSDYVVLDLGAGTSYNSLDFYVYSDIGLLTLLPEPTSIENAYRFIKSVFFRRLMVARDLEPVRPLIRAAMDSKNAYNIRTPSDLFREVSRVNPECAIKLKEEVEKYRPKLIVNQARTQADVDIGFSVKTVCKKYFGIEMDYVGYLDYDSAVWQAIRRKRPLMLEFPNSRLVSSIERIVNYVLKRHGHTKNVL